MHAHQETEIKLYVPDLTAVEERLQAHGAQLVHPRMYERNLRYEDAAHSLTPRGIVLRLRQDANATLTYKEDGGAFVNGISRRFEAEVMIDDLETMALILEKLGFSPYMSYEKYRTTYQYNGCEVVLDEMPYGHFVEIEGEPEAIEATLSGLSLARAPRMTASYALLFDRLRTRLDLPFSDLTFENFAGISVPEGFFSENARLTDDSDGN